MEGAAPLYDGRFWRLFAGTVLGSATMTSLALGPATGGAGTLADGLWQTARLILAAVLIGGTAAILPALAIWALLWRGMSGWRLRDRGRAVLGTALAIVTVPLVLAALTKTVAAAEAVAGVALIFVLMGLPAALILGPGLAAWLYRDAP